MEVRAQLANVKIHFKSAEFTEFSTWEPHSMLIMKSSSHEWRGKILNINCVVSEFNRSRGSILSRWKIFSAPSHCIKKHFIHKATVCSDSMLNIEEEKNMDLERRSPYLHIYTLLLIFLVCARMCRIFFSLWLIRTRLCHVLCSLFGLSVALAHDVQPFFKGFHTYTLSLSVEGRRWDSKFKWNRDESEKLTHGCWLNDSDFMRKFRKFSDGEKLWRNF